MDIEILYFILMIATFIVTTVKFKLPTAVSMLIAALVGILSYGIISAPDQLLHIPRHLVDGGLSFIDPVITVAAAMLFMKVVQATGALDLVSVGVLKLLHKRPTLLLMALMLILMFPSMITGSSATAVVTSGAMIAPILIAIGVPKKETTAIVASGAVFGMIAPPINIPVMLICDIVDMPYIGFTLPLLLITVPLAIFTVLYLGRKHIKKIDLEELKKEGKINFDISKEVNWLAYLPLILMIVLMVSVNVFPQAFPQLGMPLVFIISMIPAFFVGKKFNFLKEASESMKVALPLMGMLFGVGMLVQVMTLNGVRGMIVYYVLTLNQVSFGRHAILLYLAAAIFVPLFGSISPFASASVFGGPVVLALGALNPVIVASALSMMAALGDFIPPSAIAGQTSARIIGVEKYNSVLPKLTVPIVVTLVFSTVFMVFLGMYY